MSNFGNEFHDFYFFSFTYKTCMLVSMEGYEKRLKNNTERQEGNKYFA